MHDLRVHPFRPHGNLVPIIESFHAFVGLFWIMFSCCNDHDGFRDSTENVCQRSQVLSWDPETQWLHVGPCIKYWVPTTGLYIPSASGSAKLIMSCGKISGTPPTLVDTTYKPAHAASRIAIPKDSVKDVFMKIDPRDKTLAGNFRFSKGKYSQIWYSLKARRCGERHPTTQSDPARGTFHASEEDQSILDHRLLLWQTQISLSYIDRHSPTTNRTLGKVAHIRGAVATRRSIPLR